MSLSVAEPGDRSASTSDWRASIVDSAWMRGIIAGLYAVGVAQLYRDATHGVGFMLLLTASVVAALYLTRRLALLAFALIVGTVALLTALYGFHVFPLRAAGATGFRWWSEWASSFLVLTGVCFFSLRHVVDQLTRSLEASNLDRQRLAASEAKFRAIYDSVSDAIFIHEIGTGKLVDVNAATCRMFRCTREEALTADPDEMSLGEPPHSGADAMEWLARAAAEGPQTFEWRSRGFDGRVFWTEVSIRRARIGETDRLVVTVRDIDERKRAQEARLRSEQRFRALSRNALDIVTVHDPKGRVIYMSPSAERVLGWGMPSAATRDPFAFVHPADRERVQARFHAVATRSAPPQAIRYRFRHADGRWVQLEAVAENMMHDPSVGGVVVTSRDVTECHVLHEQLLHAQKMESIGRLAGGVAHDFNNLLTSILGYTNLAAERLLPGSEAAGWLDAVRQAGERAAELTSQLLAFARQQVSEPRVVDVNAIVRETETVLQRTLGEDIELVSILNPDPCWVRMDAGQCQQVLLNLAINARDAMPGGGILTIATDIVDLPEPDVEGNETIDPGRYVVLTVRDTGVGMDAQTLQRIFEPFFTTKEGGKGTGLGLATCDGIVHQSGGRIRVRSALGMGTTFSIYLPTAEAAPGPVEEPAAMRLDPMGDETVLIVEDDAAVREFFATVLRGKGYQVLTASGGLEALRMAQSYQGPIHVLLTDVVMPGMRGDALAEMLRETRPETRVIFTSGYAEGLGDRDWLAQEGYLFLQKPCRSAQLAARVREAIDTAPGDTTAGSPDAGA